MARVTGEKVKFARYSKGNRRERAALLERLERCLLQIGIEEKTIGDAEEAKKRRAADHAVGRAYVAGGLEDVVVFLESRRAILTALHEHRDLLRKQIEELDNPPVAQTKKRTANQTRLVELQKERSRASADVQRVIARLVPSLRRHQEICGEMVRLASAVELETAGGFSWLEGSQSRSILTVLTDVDLPGEDRQHLEWFKRELAGEEHPQPEPAPQPPLPAINNPAASQARYEAMKPARHEVDARRNDAILRNRPFSERRIAGL